MYVIDPETPAQPDAGQPDAAAAATSAPDAPAPATPAAPAPESAVDPADGMLAALKDAGEMPADEPAPATPAAVEPPVPGTPEAAAAEAARGEAPTKPEAGAPDPDAEIAAEAKSLGLKDKANERFVTMAKEIKQLAPIRDALKAAGIEDVAQIPVLAKRAADGDYLVEMVSGTGCTADDFTRVLEYMGTIAKGRKGDRASVEKAFEAVGAEYAAIAKALGKEIPGVHDPLAEHADLRAQIDAGDITRKAALEVVQARSTAAAVAAQQQQAQQQTQATQAQQQQIQQGVASLQAWEAPKIADPGYAAIRPALNAKVAEIRQQFQPAQWAAATEMAYQALAAEAKAAAALVAPVPRQPVPGPVRPSGPRPAMMPTTDDPIEAMMQGIAEAT